MTHQGCLDGLDGQFLATVSNAADGQDGPDLVAEQETVPPEKHTSIQKGFALGGHCSQVDRGANHNSGKGLVIQEGNQGIEVIIPAALQMIPAVSAVQTSLYIQICQFHNLGLDLI
jgi:hypothetical protein